VAQFFVGVVVGASAAALLMILIGPSRRVRAEKPLERDVETKLLLGEDPDDAAPPTPSSSPDHPRQYTSDELAQLRRIGSSPRRRRRG
jgi:hypothetical protein